MTSDSSPNNSGLSSTCIHHYIISSPEGITSTGVCKLCGYTRDFNNYLPNDYSGNGGMFPGKLQFRRYAKTNPEVMVIKPAWLKL